MFKTIKIFFAIFTLYLITTSIYASDSNRPKIGLVLSGGGARGFAHVGILKMLDSLQIPVDYIAGTSMGGIIGALYAIGYNSEEIEDIVLNSNWREILTDSPHRSMLPYFQKKETGKYQLEFGLKGITPVVPVGLIHGQKIFLFLSKLTLSYEGISDFDDLPVPFRCIAVDLISGNEVVLKRGSLARAMRATMSIPTIFSPVEWGDSLLIDGGLLNNLPVDVVQDMGADIVIAVNVGTPLKKRKKLQSIINILEQSINLGGYIREKENIEIADILISPQLENISAADFDDEKIKKIIRLGDMAAQESLPDLINLKNLCQLERLEDRPRSPNNMTKENMIIHGVSITGNTTLPFNFIYRLLGVKPSDTFDPALLERRINELYGLGYFETIHYEIEQVTAKSVHLILHVKERPIRKLRVGLRYDDLHQLVAVIGMQGTNVLFPGLRLEGELQFAGLTRLRYRASYPSRTLNLPIYPFFRFEYKDILKNIYDLEGNKVATYHDRSTTFGPGLGLLLGKFFNVEVEYHHEVMNIKPSVGIHEMFTSWKDRLRKIRLSADMDFLDDVLLPREGIVIRGNYEGSFKSLGSAIDYTHQEIYANIYHTIYRRHTGRIFAFWGESGGDLPIYNFFYKSEPDKFIGVEYDQLVARKLNILRFDYRYEYKKDIFIKLIVNAALNCKYRYQSYIFTKNILWGYGLGLKVLSPAGPLQIIFARGKKSVYAKSKDRNVFYFTAGYKF